MAGKKYTQPYYIGKPFHPHPINLVRKLKESKDKPKGVTSVESGAKTFKSGDDFVFPFSKEYDTSPNIIVVAVQGENKFSGTGLIKAYGANWKSIFGLGTQSQFDDLEVGEIHGTYLSSGSIQLLNNTSFETTPGNEWEKYATTDSISLKGLAVPITYATYEWVAIWVDQVSE